MAWGPSVVYDPTVLRVPVWLELRVGFPFSGWIMIMSRAGSREIRLPFLIFCGHLRCNV